MKKVISLLLALVLIFSLSACGKTGDKSEDTIEEPSTPAQKLLAVFKSETKTVDNSPLALAETLIGQDFIPFAGGAMEVSEGWLTGFDGEITGFNEGAVFMPMIGAIPFVGYVFEVDKANVDSFVSQLKDLANPRWNVCTEADETVCETVDTLVFFVMAPASFDDAE